MVVVGKVIVIGEEVAVFVRGVGVAVDSVVAVVVAVPVFAGETVVLREEVKVVVGAVTVIVV